MKFFSKVSNYRVILRHGIPAEPITGRAVVPSLFVKFENGVADVKDAEMIRLMLVHPAYQSDYISSENQVEDPYVSNRRPNEPEHDVVELKYGHVGRNLNPKPKITLSRDQKNAIDSMVKEMASKLAAEMAPKMASELLTKLAANQQKSVELTPPDAIEEDDSQVEERVNEENNLEKIQDALTRDTVTDLTFNVDSGLSVGGELKKSNLGDQTKRKRGNPNFVKKN